MSHAEGFLRELRRRRVFQTAALYAVGAWIALQVADLAFPGLGIPEEAIRYVWIGAFAGFPLALLFAWRYQVTRQGIARTSPLDGDDTETLPLGGADYVILGALLLVAGGVAYQVVTQIRELPASAGLAAGGREISPNSVAVLPLENVSGSPEQEYFVAGMHDALITDLSKISALRVISRSSAKVYENVVQPVRQTALELGVAKLIDGSVFRTGDHVRINLQLIDAASGENLWSESYERDIEDVLTLQSEIARAVAEQVRVELTPDEESRLASARRVNPDVYETYLRGMFHLNQYTPEGIRTGLEHLHRAVEMDPEDPLAHAGLALGYTLIGHSANPPPGAFRRAREAAATALELDPLFPEAHAAMAEIRLYYGWDWEGARRSFRRALQLNPNLEFAHAHYGWYHQLMGNIDRAIEHMERARQIAPVTPIFTVWLGWLYWERKRFDEAIAEARRALELNPGFPWGLYVLGGVYADRGEFDEALAMHGRLLEIRPNLGRWGLGYSYALAGREEEARAVLAELAADPGQKDLLLLGFLHAALGDEEEALRWLETAYEARVDWFPWIAAGARAGPISVARDSLGDEPRFLELVARLDLPRRE